MKIKSIVVALSMVVSSQAFAAYEEQSTSGIIPTDIQWPMSSKDIRSTSIFFDVEDAVESVGRSCANNHFPTHLGVDIRAIQSTSVVPTYPGEVVRKGMDYGWGNYVVISHNNNTWTSVYWHLDSVNVSVGQEVDKTTVIGDVYDTSPNGDVSHLHFGMREGAYSSTYSKIGYKGCGSDLYGFVNPLDYLPSKGYQLVDDQSAIHSGNWKDSVSTDFYSGEGYKALDSSYNGTATYEYTAGSSRKYSIYAKFPVEPNRTTSAKYQLYVNGSLKATKYVDQTDQNNRGDNVFLFSYSLSYGNKVKVVVSNSNGSGWLISDAILFRVWN